MISNLGKLYQMLGYEFRDENLIRLALTHRSMPSPHNERLEFLGDSLLNFIIADELYRQYPDFREGELSRVRASLVNGNALAEIAREFGIGIYLRLGVGEKKSGGAQRNSILANAIEAIICAIYLDAGIQTCRDVVLGWYMSRIGKVPSIIVKKDAKTSLQEYLQHHKLPLPNYLIASVGGQSHAQTFYIECQVEGIPHITKGQGSSRRRAEQDAAEQMLDLLRSE